MVKQPQRAEGPLRAPTWALLRFLIKSFMAIDVNRDQEPGKLMLKVKTKMMKA